MARKLREECPGAMYHAMNRGDRLEAIFCDEDDRVLFVATLAESLGKTAFLIQNVCLMSNHFHLVVQTPQRQLA
jgi:REP element-mobilizing transposase RayT